MALYDTKVMREDSTPWHIEEWKQPYGRLLVHYHLQTAWLFEANYWAQKTHSSVLQIT